MNLIKEKFCDYNLKEGTINFPPTYKYIKESLIYDNNTTKKAKAKIQDDSEYKYIENYLKEKLGTTVKISNNKINIKFSSVHDLNRILEIMNIKIDN